MMSMEEQREEAEVDARWFAERLPSRGELEELLGDEPTAALLQATRSRAPVETGFVSLPGDVAANPEVVHEMEIAAAAALKLKKAVAPDLSAEEIRALHAFVHLVARPALRVFNQQAPSSPLSWPVLDHDRDVITCRIRGVGRLDTAERSPTGTGWLVAPDLLMTNNHVVAQLCGIPVHGTPLWRQRLDSVWPAQSALWESDSARRPIWDPGDSPGASTTPAGRVRRVRGIHPAFDLALLEVEGVTDSGDLVLSLSATGPSQEKGEQVYVPGYPAVSDRLGLHPALLTLLFGGASQDVHKRVAPGLLCGVTGSSVTHDASTLGGSSGSPLIRFHDHRVVGLHFRGVYGTANHAVPLWKLRDDPIFAGTGVRFE